MQIDKGSRFVALHHEVHPKAYSNVLLHLKKKISYETF